MDEGLKKRLVGAAVLVSLIVIFVPMLLEHEPAIESDISKTNIPPRPESDFSSRVLPMESENLADPSEQVTPLLQETEQKQPPMAADTQLSVQTEKGEAAPSKKPAVKPRVGLSAWVIQVGSFSNRANAKKLSKQLQDKGFSAFLEQTEIKGKTLFRVKVGPEINRKLAEKMLLRVNKELKSDKLQGKLISYP